MRRIERSRRRWAAASVAVYVLSFAVVLRFQPHGPDGPDGPLVDCLTLILYAPLWFMLQIIGGLTA